MYFDLLRCFTYIFFQYPGDIFFNANYIVTETLNFVAVRRETLLELIMTVVTQRRTVANTAQPKRDGLIKRDTSL